LEPVEPIRIKGLSHTYPRGGKAVQALSRIDLDVERGEFLTIIGPSGCGKTTLLYILAGLIRPTSYEELLVEGREVKAPDPRSVALVFQDSGLLFWKTVLANVEFGLELRGVPKPERARKALERIKEVGLDGFEGNYPAELSGGMKQRASLARALSLETPILLLDEPFGALDEQTRILMAEQLLRLCADGKRTVVLVTHSLQEAAMLSDKVVVLTARPGRVHSTLDLPDARPRTPEKVSEIRNRLWEQLKVISEDALLQERQDRLS
jgi:NitT/TauT family transport system ATP-binding protein